MERIALTGGMYSGKSTLAAELEKQGYMRIIFTDQLKQYATYALEACGIDVTVGEINADKKKYRVFLQGLGTLIGFDTNTWYVRDLLPEWKRAGMPPVVFDNVRTPEQYAELKRYDFKLVRVEVPLITQADRAAAAGVSLEELLKLRAHPIEQGIGLTPDLVVDGTIDPQTNARFLIGEKEYTLQETHK